MNWVTRPGVHIDRAACAWLIRRHIDPDATFSFGAGPGTAFDMPGAELGHHGGDCTFETMLRHYGLTDPVLWRIAEAVHEADLGDDRFAAPEAPGLDAIVRGLSLLHPDQQVIDLTGPLFDGLHEYHRQRLVLGREPA